MPKSTGVPIIALTRSDENISTINNILREAGHPVHCTRVEQPNTLEDALRSDIPELVIIFTEERVADLAEIAAQLNKLDAPPPLLLVQSRIDEQSIAEAMEAGARDVVSITHKNRFKAVVTRELQAHRMRVALGNVVYSARQYRNELKTLMNGSTEAIADIQEGILIAANPSWLELFGYDDADQLINLPFMDICQAADQPMIKGAIVACLKQKWDGSELKMTGIHANGSAVPVEINLERVTIDGDPAVRIVVPGQRTVDGPPEDLLETALYKDPATGFYHRRYFIDKVDERLRIPLGGGVRALIYIRPDDFARVHDDIGMLATEDLLTKLANLLKDSMLPDDLYGRFGGTMFMALLERGTMTDVETWAEQIRKRIEAQVFEVDDQSTSLTCTVGLTEVIDQEQTTGELLSNVELACRTGRDNGGNRVHTNADTGTTTSTRAADQIWMTRLRHALMKNRLRLVHQPISGLTEEVSGLFDTRVQMLDESGGTILPGEFVPAAERSGMMKNIDRWVIGASLSFCVKKNPRLVFIRLSADSINDESLLEWLDSRLNSTGVSPAKICFQVSEDVASQYLKQAKELAEQLRAKGFAFAIDHMGLGRDPYQVLNHVPMDFMKIDGSLMQGLHLESGVQKAVGDLARQAVELKIKPIAERIEDANTMAVLFQLGIGLIQGNYVQMHGVVLEDTQTVRGLSLGQ